MFTSNDDALVEVACEKNGKCDIDQRAFKGIAVRSFGRAAQVAPLVAEPIHTMLLASAKGAADNCEDSGDSVACSLNWSGESAWEQATAADGNLGEVLNALQAVQALLWSTVDITRAGAGDSTPSGASSPNATASGSPSGTSSNVAQHTGTGATVAASFTFSLAVAFAVALSF